MHVKKLSGGRPFRRGRGGFALTPARQEWLIVWALRLGFALVALLSAYVFVFGS